MRKAQVWELRTADGEQVNGLQLSWHRDDGSLKDLGFRTCVDDKCSAEALEGRTTATDSVRRRVPMQLSPLLK